jgi:hypothetical protein
MYHNTTFMSLNVASLNIIVSVADELSQHLISSFKYLDPHFHSQTTGLSIVNMNIPRNNGEPLELRIIFILFHIRKHHRPLKAFSF